jgi:hypothetical protein
MAGNRVDPTNSVIAGVGVASGGTVAAGGRVDCGGMVEAKGRVGGTVEVAPEGSVSNGDARGKVDIGKGVKLIVALGAFGGSVSCWSECFVSCSV